MGVPRKKTYDEGLVTERALQLFWSKGYKKSTARMMEEAMGINLFSIYSSFGSKEGLLIECLKAYKSANQELLLDPLRKGDYVDDIREYFENFLRFTRDENGYRGCLLINTAQEFGADLNPKASTLISGFSEKIVFEFHRILAASGNSNATQVANYLFVSLVGLITTSKLMIDTQIKDYLDVTFDRL